VTYMENLRYTQKDKNGKSVFGAKIKEKNGK
jgi:uncharacterized protein (DUF342 family)